MYYTKLTYKHWQIFQDVVPADQVPENLLSRFLNRWGINYDWHDPAGLLAITPNQIQPDVGCVIFCAKTTPLMMSIAAMDETKELFKKRAFTTEDGGLMFSSLAYTLPDVPGIDTQLGLIHDLGFEEGDKINGYRLFLKHYEGETSCAHPEPQH